MPAPVLTVAAVAAAAITFLATVFTRDALLAFGGFCAFWLFIFVPTYHICNDLIDIVMVAACAAIYFAMGAATAQLLRINQLIDFWPQRTSVRDSLNVPFLFIALLAAFFTTFFAVAAATPPPDLPYDVCADMLAIFWQDLIDLGTTVNIILAVMSGLIALAAAGMSARYPPKAPGQGFTAQLYLVVLLFSFGLPLIMWYGCSPDIPGNWSCNFSDTTRGLISGGIGAGVLLVGMAVGFVYERLLDDKLAQEPGKRDVYTPIPGRFFSSADTGITWIDVLRLFTIVLLYFGLWAIGGYAEDKSMAPNQVADMFWSHGFGLYALIVSVVFLLLIFILWFLMIWRSSKSKKDSGKNDELEALIPEPPTDVSPSFPPPPPNEARRRRTAAKAAAGSSDLSGVRFNF